MPLSTADVPSPEPRPRRSAKPSPPSSAASSASPSEGASASPARVLAPAAESSDPTVHKLLADIDIARQVGDDAAVERATASLAELGYR